ncbi:uncharacterized protein LOC133203446 [Saccostrea echinata]|uniref:uncharacterized protein LOC133203446 n=1 Tax=Saccostrea echinata TaxID=191078 RepID=UPI002A805686|nr:uncharacterized protein LOC133203446 [Saccostrea echinata]
MANPQAQDIIRCRYCEDEPAVFHCIPCGDDLCPGCKVFHLKSKVPSGHNIVRLSDKFHANNQIKMCEVHSSKAYEACCKDCQAPVCILCIQEVHGEHAIGKIQDLYEKQKAETAEELCKIKTQLKLEIIQRIKDFNEEEKEIKTCHENIREKMKKQGQDFINHIISILREALHESEEDEKRKSEEIFHQKEENEKFDQSLDHLIGKFEALTRSNHPADFLLYLKKNPNTFRELKFPEKVTIAKPLFTAGRFNKFKNKHQFGKFIAGQISHLKSVDDSLQAIQPTFKKVLERSVKLSELKTKREKLLHVRCLDDRSAYISGRGLRILLIDSSGTELDSISTDRQPFGLAVMQDRSLIYSDFEDKVIYRMSLDKKKTKLLNTMYHPRGLCCSRSCDILVCMSDYKYSLSGRVVKYSNSGEILQVFLEDQNGKRLFVNPYFVCENVNDDICISDIEIKNSKVVVLNRSGELQFKYYGNIQSRTSKKEFKPLGLATNSLGHILVADNANNAIHLINQDGNFLSYILTEDDGISRPWGISVDTSDNLWLVEHTNACVKLYKFLS